MLIEKLKDEGCEWAFEKINLVLENKKLAIVKRRNKICSKKKKEIT